MMFQHDERASKMNRTLISFECVHKFEMSISLPLTLSLSLFHCNNISVMFLISSVMAWQSVDKCKRQFNDENGIWYPKTPTDLIFTRNK